MEILAVNRQYVEGPRTWPLAAKQELGEVATAVRFQTADLSVKDRAVRADRVRDFFGELRPRPEYVAVAGDEFAAVSGDVSECSEAVDLRPEQELRMIERLGDSQESHGRDGHGGRSEPHIWSPVRRSSAAVNTSR